MAEARKAHRSEIRKQAKAIISGRTDVACTIRDMSALGARLSFSTPTFLPRQFHLSGGDIDQRVTVIWQAGVLAGVRFQDPIRGLPAKPKRWPWSKG